eukprot:scaffold4561_cov184-Alexandrium_tamarense.AAC.10
MQEIRQRTVTSIPLASKEGAEVCVLDGDTTENTSFRRNSHPIKPAIKRAIVVIDQPMRLPPSSMWNE